jgi:hypothetical protein
MKRVARLLPGIISLTLFVTTATAAQFKVAWQRANDFESVSFDGLTSPIVKVDARGNVCVAAVHGYHVGQGVIHDYVVVKRTAQGRLLWQTHVPTGVQASVRALELDRAGNVYVTGSGGTAKFTAGGQVAWAIPFGDREDGWKDFQDLDVDDTGNVYVTGHSLHDRNFLSTVSITTIKYNAEGQQRWVQQYAGGFIYWDPSQQHVEVDETGNVYVAGAVRPHPSSSEEWAIIKYNSDGHEVWTRGHAGGFASVHDLVLDRRGDLLITGFDGGHVTLKYDPDGNRLWEAHQPAAGFGSKIGLDHFGNIYVRSWNNDEETTSHSLLKFNSRGRHQWTRQITGAFGWGHAFTVDKAGNAYLGVKLSVTKFDPRGRQILTIPLSHEPSAVAVDWPNQLIVTTPATTTKFITK